MQHAKGALEASQREMAQTSGALATRLAHAQQQLCEMAAARRAAADRLQELQGGIRVLVRCRPLARRELAAAEGGAVAVPSRAALCLSVDDGKPGGGAVPHDFSFDAVLGADCGGRQVYEEVSPAVASVLQGQYVCVMAYGQTGAGKTFTMQGGGPGQPGVVRLAAEEIFGEAKLMQASAEVSRQLEELKGQYSQQINDLKAQYHDLARALKKEKTAATATGIRTSWQRRQLADAGARC